jgi:hypothetical protein
VVEELLGCAGFPGFVFIIPVCSRLDLKYQRWVGPGGAAAYLVFGRFHVRAVAVHDYPLLHRTAVLPDLLLPPDGKNLPGLDLLIPGDRLGMGDWPSDQYFPVVQGWFLSSFRCGDALNDEWLVLVLGDERLLR